MRLLRCNNNLLSTISKIRTSTCLAEVLKQLASSSTVSRNIVGGGGGVYFPSDILGTKSTFFVCSFSERTANNRATSSSTSVALGCKPHHTNENSISQTYEISISFHAVIDIGRWAQYACACISKYFNITT